MRLYDLKAGMNTRRVRIFLAEKNLQMPAIDIDMNAGENRSHRVSDQESNGCHARAGTRRRVLSRRVSGDLPLSGRGNPA